MIVQVILFSLLTSLPQGCEDRLGREAARQAVDRWPGWSVVKLEDLSADDRNIVGQRWGGGFCPGVAVGHFVSTARRSAAILLQRLEGTRRREMVVVASSRRDGELRWETASPPTLSDVVSVLRTVGPGLYKDARNRPYRIRRDAIVYEQVESGTALLFHSSGRFTAVAIAF